MSNSQTGKYAIESIEQLSWFSGNYRWDWKIIGADSINEGEDITLTIEGRNAPKENVWPIVVKTSTNTASQQDFNEESDIYIMPQDTDSGNAGFWRSTFTVQTNEDSLIEGDEKFYVNLYDSNVAYGCARTSKEIAIIDNDSVNMPSENIDPSNKNGNGNLVEGNIDLGSVHNSFIVEIAPLSLP